MQRIISHLQLYIHWLDSLPLIHLVGAFAPIPPDVPPGGISLWPKLLFPVLEHLVGLTFELRGKRMFRTASYLCGQTPINLGNHVLSLAGSRNRLHHEEGT